MVDPSLLRKTDSWLSKTHLILDEMVARGNLIAGLRKAELQQLDDTLTKLHTTTPVTARDSSISIRHSFDGDDTNTGTGGESARDVGSRHSQIPFEPLHDWNSEEGLSGDQLIAVADSLDFTNLDWLSATPLDQLDGC